MKHMHYSPVNGRPIVPMLAAAYRKNNPTAVWEFNPWTGKRRHQDDIQSDPLGLAIVDDLTEPLRAAEIDPQRVAVHAVDDECSCFPGLCRGGQVIDGKTPGGLTCKAHQPAPIEAPVQFGQRPARKHNHYFKDVSHLRTVDVYRVLALFNVTDPCIQHAVKKLLVAGGRGAGKDISRDIKEAIDSLQRWQEMRDEDAVGEF